MVAGFCGNGHEFPVSVELPGFDSRRGIGVFILATASRLALASIYPLIKRITGDIFLAIKRPGREAYHLPPSTDEVKNEWSYTFTPPTRLHGVVLS
jgi:hypothetical protein